MLLKTNPPSVKAGYEPVNDTLLYFIMQWYAMWGGGILYRFYSDNQTIYHKIDSSTVCTRYKDHRCNAESVITQ